jgi:hypothetical protein
MKSTHLFRNFVFLFSLFGLGGLVSANSFTLSLATERQGVQQSGPEYSDEVVAEGNESIVIEVVNYSYETVSYVGTISLDVDANNGWVPLIKNSNVLPSDKITLQGPCKMRIQGRNHYNNSFYYRLYMDVLYTIAPKEKEAPSKKFATVIPENASTNIRVVLEQSTDLINWTTAAPGVFPPSTAKRFFRVRSEEE